MISFVKGVAEGFTESAVIVDCGGIGYYIGTTQGTIAKIAIGELVKLYTSMQVKEDGISLYGFLREDEMAMFLLLISVSGVGPKSALSLLNLSNPTQLSLAILTEDVDLLAKAQGIGKKTAQRISLELKDKIKGSESVAGLNPQQSLNVHNSGVKQDALNALLSLGYGRGEALRVVMEVAVEGMTVEQIIKSALKKLAR